jgi:steroid delta-isomerase-like uncharacterized protein
MNLDTRSTDAERIALMLLERWNGRDLDGFVALLAADVEWYDPAMPAPPIRGHAGVREFAQAMLAAFPDFNYEVLGQPCAAADGTKCALHWRITATHTAPLVPPGFAPTGRQLCQEGVDLLEIRSGKVTRILTCFDALAAAEQLMGVSLRPAPGSLRERLAVAIQRVLAFRARRLTKRLKLPPRAAA